MIENQCQECGSHPYNCLCSDRDCCVCGHTMSLIPGLEWPEGDIYCWGCAHNKIYELEARKTKPA